MLRRPHALAVPRRRIVAAGILAALLAGCAPAISPELRRQAVPVPNFRVLQADPAAFEGKLIILGGEVIDVDNRPQETRIRVLQKPLAWDLSPATADTSGGRFVVRYRGYLDPVLYAPGRRLTVAGVVRGSETGRIGDMEYRYPVLEAREIHLWPQVERLPWDGPAGWYPWWYDPRWGTRPWWW